MTITEYKRKWVDERVAELRASGLTDAAIARRMKISPPWFRQAMNKPTVGDSFITKLCQAFALRFTIPNELGEDKTESITAEGAPPDLSAKVRELYEAHERILARVERLMDRYEAVVVERDALKAERDTLRAQLAKAAQN